MSIMREVLRAFEDGRKQYEELIEMISAVGQQPDFTVCEVYGAGAKVCSAAAAGCDGRHAKICGIDGNIDGKIASGDNLEYMMHLLRNVRYARKGAADICRSAVFFRQQI